jgi:hypothetical protein
MSDHSSILRTLGNFALLGFVVLGVGLGALAILIKSDESKDKELADEKNERGGESDEGKETLIFKFREMFDYEGTVRVGDGRGSMGITPITAENGGNKTIDLNDLLELAREMERKVDYLADGTTRVEQAVAWFTYRDRLHYVLLVRPFERVAHEMMKRGGEDLFLSFLGSDGERVLPPSAPEQIPTRSLRVAVTKAKRIPAGWVAYGELPLYGASGESIAEPQVGWIFSGGLHARLQKLLRANIVREEGMHDPFRLDFEAGAKGIGQ